MDLTNGTKNESNQARHEVMLIINGVLNAPLMLISIIGNTLVLAAILRTPSLRSPSFTLLCSLAVSDLLVGLVVQPLYIVKDLTDGLYVCSICEIMAFILCGVSLVTLTAISVDRFAALHYHMRYVTLVTIPRVVCTVVFIWLMNSLTLGLYLWNRINYFIVSFAGIGICFQVSSFSYFRIFRIVHQHQFQIHIQQQAVQSAADGNVLHIVRLKKSAINTFIFYIFIIMCYFPKLISLCLYITSNKNWTNVWNFADTVVFMNSSVNPILYCWRLRELRMPVVQTIRKMFCRNTQDN